MIKALLILCLVTNPVCLTLPILIHYLVSPQTKVQGIGQVNPLPTRFVMFVPRCPFHLISISELTHTYPCFVIFANDSVLEQDQGPRQTIGIGCESRGLYHLTVLASPTICSVVEFHHLTSLSV